MKVLVAGAGAVGGYVAARLMEAGVNVTLMVREARKKKLEETGLAVVSPLGDYTGHPMMITAGEEAGPFDLIAIAMKAYGLSEALEQLRPYVSEHTVLLPFLNGIRHMDEIAAAYPGRPLLGGVARIEAALDDAGRVMHSSSHAMLTYGNFSNIKEERYEAIRTSLSGIPLLREHPEIALDMWDKFLFISVLSGITTLFDATVGEIRRVPEGFGWFERLYAEASEIIRSAGGTLSDGIVERQLKAIAGMSGQSTASMHRDLRQGRPTEGSHIHGHLLALARRHQVHAPLLETVHQRLMIYESKRTQLISG